MEPELNDETIAVINEAAGSGTVGMTQVVNAEPDGYKLAFVAGGPLTVQPHFGQTTYGYDDVRPIARVATAPLVLAVAADAPWDTIEDLVADLKENPGSFRYSSTGTGNPANIAMEKFDAAAGVDTKQVPFESSSEAVTALLGGNVDGAAGLPSGFTASVENGDLKLLANLGDVKGDTFADVPTLVESGYDAVTNVTSGLVAPLDTSDEVADAITEAVRLAIEDPKTLETIEATGALPNFGDADEYAVDIKADYDENGTVLEELGLVE